MKVIGDQIELHFKDSGETVRYQFLDFVTMTIDGTPRKYLFVTDPQNVETVIVLRVMGDDVLPIRDRNELELVQRQLHGKLD